ncbi:Chorismate synthase [Colletotrichum sp. SAR11_240]|nr:Chorismate synthase [Colletotrichum sp. SAR11_240]
MSTFGHYFRVTTMGDWALTTKTIDLYPCLSHAYGIEIAAFVFSVGNIKLFEDRPSTNSDDDIDSLSGNPRFLEFVDSLTREKVDEFLPVRCPDELRDQHDSAGGTLTYIIRGCPSGLGEPCFDRLEALLAHAIKSILAARDRHDPNVAPLAVSIVEAMAALTIAGAIMAQHARQMGMKIRSWKMVH